MDESAKNQQLLISYALKKGGWRNMPLPSDWIQITHQNAVLYINKTGCTILDVHPFKYLALGNEKEKKLVKKTISHQYDPKKKNQNYISCWATCPFPESGWIKLYHIIKHQIIYYYQPTNTLTAKHPCRVVKPKTASTKPLHQSKVKAKVNKEKQVNNHKKARKRKRLDSFDKLIKLLNSPGPSDSSNPNAANPQSPLHLDKFIENDLQNMKNIKYGKSHTSHEHRKNQKIKKKAIKTRLRPSTPPPQSSNLPQRFDIVPRSSKTPRPSKNSRRTQSSLPNGRNDEKSKIKTKSTKQLRMSSKNFKKLKTKNKSKSVNKKSQKHNKKTVNFNTKDLSIQIKPQINMKNNKKKSVSFKKQLPSVNTALSPTSYSSEQISTNKTSVAKLKSPTPKTKKMIKKSNKKRYKHVKKLENMHMTTTPPSTQTRPKRRSLSNKFKHISAVATDKPVKPVKQAPMDSQSQYQNNTILNDYKWGSSYTHSLSKSVYMYAASRGNNVLFPVQNNNQSAGNNLTKTRKLSNPKNKYKKQKKPTKSRISLSTQHNNHNYNHNHSDIIKARSKISSPQKRRRNAAVGMSSQIQSQLLNFDDKLIFVNDASYGLKNDIPDEATKYNNVINLNVDLPIVETNYKTNSLPTTPTLLPQSTSDNIYETAKADRTTPKAVPNMSLSKSSPVTPIRTTPILTSYNNNSPGSDLDLYDLYDVKYNAHKLEIKSNIHHHSNSDDELDLDAKNNINDNDILSINFPRKPSSKSFELHDTNRTHGSGSGRGRDRRRHRTHSHSSTSSSISRKSSISVVSVISAVSDDNERRTSSSISLSDSDSSDQSSISSVSDSDSDSDSSSNSMSLSDSSASHSRSGRSRSRNRRSRTHSRSSCGSSVSSRSATPSRYRSGSDLNSQKTQKLQNSLFNNMANMMLMMTNTSFSTSGSGAGLQQNISNFSNSLTNDKYTSSSSSFVNMNGILSPPSMSPCYSNSSKWDTSVFDLDSPTHKTNINNKAGKINNNFDDFMTFMTNFSSDKINNSSNNNNNNNNNIFNAFGAGSKDVHVQNAIDITTTNITATNSDENNRVTNEKGIGYQNRIASIMLTNSYADDTSGSASDIDAVNGSVV